ncbi:CBO0543 family protein [Clostridium sp. BJN0013]|uniref:CBO0543 family protein n=1 Tax=Clostridium sp. BJN0013 TaxID=3236840 RepID=UPI0034C6528A
MSHIPFDIVLYPIIGVYMLYFIKNKKLKSFFIISFTALLTTFLEFLGVIAGRVIYNKGWSIHYTFFSYMFSYTTLYCLYLYLKKLKIFN